MWFSLSEHIQRPKSVICFLKLYLERDAGSILDLKRHFLPIQRDLSGVERSWRWWWWGRGCEWMDRQRLFPQKWRMKRAIMWTETHLCLLRNPRWTAWSETWRSELKETRRREFFLGISILTVGLMWRTKRVWYISLHRENGVFGTVANLRRPTDLHHTEMLASLEFTVSMINSWCLQLWEEFKVWTA